MLADPALAPDRALLQEYARSRDADAFAELAKRHAGLVYGTCWRVLGNEDDAQDVAQECFLELARKAGAIHSSLPAWLHKLARSRSVDAIRKSASRRRVEELAAREASAESGPTWMEIAPYVDEALQGLPEHLSAPIILHYLKGYTQAQVSAELGVHQSTVSRQIETGITKLRERLKDAGVLTPVTALALLLTEKACEAAPDALSAALGKMAVSGVGGSLVVPTYQIGGLIVKKVWLHAAAAAIVLASACAVVVPRLAANDAAQPAPTLASAGRESGRLVEIKMEYFGVSGKVAADLQSQWHFEEDATKGFAAATLDAAGAKAMKAKMLEAGAKAVGSPTVTTVNRQVYMTYCMTTDSFTKTWKIVAGANVDGSTTLEFTSVPMPSDRPAADSSPCFGCQVRPGGALALMPAQYGANDNVTVLIITPEMVDGPAASETAIVPGAKAIQVEAQVFQVPTELASKLGLNPQTSRNGSKTAPDASAKLLATLKACKEVATLSSTISTLDGQTATIIVSTAANEGTPETGTSLRVTPHIDARDAVSLEVMFSVTAASGKQSVFTQRKVADGEPTILTGMVTESGELVLVLTPRIIK